ncbi:MAG: DNA polymerase III subunit delta [Eggerthellaceae bacterium]|nr:DNA polymerase III subunit delta [Eggerthellaceae bacterium]
MMDSFENILGQPQVRKFLRATVKSGRIGQSYLFCGASGSNKTLAAYAFAQAILCSNEHLDERGGGCGRCGVCARVMNRKHPDVKYYSPEGAQGYLIEQIRDIVHDTRLAPIESEKKIYIIDRADLLGTSAANAFLKTLEEPPDDVVMILLGRSVDSVLATIVSRCQVVPFRHIPAKEAAGIVVQNTGVSEFKANVALAACSGSLTKAVEFLRTPGNERLAFREKVIDMLFSLRLADDWDILGFAERLVTDARLPLDSVRQGLEEELAKNSDFMEKSALRRIEAKNKRQVSAQSFEFLLQLTAIIRSWLRDILLICAGTPELIVNTDVAERLAEAAERTDAGLIAQAMDAVSECDESLIRNVSPQTCIDTLLFDLREVLNGKNCACQPVV